MNQQIMNLFSPIKQLLRTLTSKGLATIGLTIVFMAAVAAFGIVRNGSLTLALASARGERILADKANQTFGMRSVGSVVELGYTLRNLTSVPITIQGAQTSCSCAVIDDIPSVIPAHSSGRIRVKITTSDVPGPISGTFSLLTDDQAKPELVLRYSGAVSAAGIDSHVRSGSD